MKLASIYIVTLVADGRVYIGQTRRNRSCGAIARWHDHVSCALTERTKTYFHNAIRKYGKEAFSFRVLETCESELANERERHHIGIYRSNEKTFGFNMSDGGDGGQNVKSEEVRRRISESKKGVSTGPCSLEKAKKISDVKLAQCRKHSAETRKLISERRKVEMLSEDWKSNISKSLLKTAKYKLAKEDVLEIQNLPKTESDAEIAKRYNVSRKMIWRVRNNLHRFQVADQALRSNSTI